MKKATLSAFIARFSCRTGKKAVLLLVFGLTTFLAKSQDLSTKRIDLDVHEVPIKEALMDIQRKSNLQFVYDGDIDKYATVKVTVRESDIPVKKALLLVLKNTNLHFVQMNDHIMITASRSVGGATTSAPGAVFLLRGKVTDEIGSALEGASVSLNGARAALTNKDGLFELSGAHDHDMLSMTFVGFARQQITVGREKFLTIQLRRDEKSMSDVVVTALNFKRNPKSLGYSITTLEGSQVNTVQTPNIISALSGKVAGVDVSNTANGVAGSKRIVIRGAASITGNTQPLWVVDGIIIDASNLGSASPTGGIDYGDGLTGINPDDIASISVLKGNAAAALYGSRASNGVILITTKRGRTDGKTSVDFSSSMLMDKFINPTDFQHEYGQTSGTQGTALPTSATDAYTASSWGHKLDGSPAVQFDGVTRPFIAHKDNFERFFRTGNTITNTLGLSGGTKSSDYRISVSDLRNTDIVPNSGYSRTGFNSKLHSQYGKMDVDVVLDYTYERAKNRPYIGGNTSNIFYSLLYLPANIDVSTLKPGYTPDGNELQFAPGVSNPYFFINKEHEEDTRNRLMGSLSLKYQFTKWLYARGRFTRDYYIFKSQQYVPQGALSTSTPLGALTQQSITNTDNNYEFILGTNPLPTGKLKIDAFAGGNIDWRAREKDNLNGQAFVVPGVYTFNNLQSKTPSTSSSTERTNSLFGSLNLSYDDYLFLTMTARNDWFSTLPVERDNLIYPSADLAFVLSDAFKLPEWVSFAKLRTSAAQVSGDPSPGQLNLSYQLSPTSYGSQQLQYISSDNIPNKDLKPLLSTDFEAGLEAGFFKNRLSIDADYFERQVRDDIVTTTVPTSTGYSTAVKNIGKLDSKGIEVLLRVTPVRLRDLSWNLTFNFSTIDNRVIALGDGTEKGANIVLASSKSGNGTIQLEEGQRYGGIYGFTYQLDTKGNKTYDATGLPLYNSNPTRLANGQYTKLAGMSSTLNYKNFSLYFQLDGKFGASIYSETNEEAYSNGKHKSTLVGRETGITGVGANQSGGTNTVTVPAINIQSYYSQISNITQQFVYSADFVKLRELALSYSFRSGLLRKAGLNSASVALVARNLAILYKDKRLENVDPESNLLSSNAQGLERMDYPPTRNFGVTLKVGF